MGMIQDFKAWSRRDGYPVTMVLIITLSLAATYFFASHFQGVELIAYAGAGAVRPWTLLTYPWGYVTGNGAALVGFIFLMVWLYTMGRSVERDMNSPKLAGFWFAATLAGALCNWVGMATTRGFAPLLGPALPIAALTIVWCTRNPAYEMRLFMVIPIAGRWVGWIVVAFTAVYFGNQFPLIGVCDCIPLLVAYLYASNRLPGLAFGSGGVYQATKKEATTRGQVMYDQSYFDEVKRREIERAENERLKKLLGED